jgi:hypothetical protein
MGRAAQTKNVLDVISLKRDAGVFAVEAQNQLRG